MESVRSCARNGSVKVMDHENFGEHGSCMDCDGFDRNSVVRPGDVGPVTTFPDWPTVRSGPAVSWTRLPVLRVAGSRQLPMYVRTMFPSLPVLLWREGVCEIMAAFVGPLAPGMCVNARRVSLPMPISRPASNLLAASSLDAIAIDAIGAVDGIAACGVRWACPAAHPLTL